MGRTIRIDDDTFEGLQALAIDNLRDTPNKVILRLLAGDAQLPPLGEPTFRLSLCHGVLTINFLETDYHCSVSYSVPVSDIPDGTDDDPAVAFWYPRS